MECHNELRVRAEKVLDQLNVKGGRFGSIQARSVKRTRKWVCHVVPAYPHVSAGPMNGSILLRWACTYRIANFSLGGLHIRAGQSDAVSPKSLPRPSLPPHMSYGLVSHAYRPTSVLFKSYCPLKQ